MRLLLVTVLMFSGTAASAGSWDWLTQYKTPNLHWGQLKLHPFYRLTQSYDSNIYLVPKDQNGFSVGAGVLGSWITRNNLGLKTSLPIGRQHQFNTEYMAEFQTYSKHPRTNNAINQRAHIDYAYAGARGLTFKAGNTYLNTNDQASSQPFERQRRWDNRVFTSMDYDKEGGRMTAGIDGEHTATKYINPTFAASLNRYAQNFGFNVGYKVQPKTVLYVSYHRGLIHYTVDRELPNQDKNNKSHSVAGGVRGELSAKVEGKVEAGMTYRQYDEAPINGLTTVTRNMTVATELTYKPQDRTTVMLSLYRSLEESLSGANRFYVANFAMLDVKHRLPNKFTAGFHGAFGLDKYPDTLTVANGSTGERRDDAYQGGAWIEYDIQQWLSTGLAYLYRERNSTFTGQFNYEDHVTTWNLALKF